jgi:FkbM family methyltransferase
MSTSYFILSKDDGRVDDNASNNIVSLSNQISYILPRNLISYYCERGLFEASLIEWCKQFCSSEKIMLDIGAHTGTYALSLASKSKHVYAFEPQKMTYYALCGGVALSNLKNVSCLNIGLGSPEQVGTNTLKIISNDGGGSSIHATSDILREETIQLDMLDNLNLTDIGFIKMDVEDNESFVLKGAMNTLKMSGFPPILFECNDKTKNMELFDIMEKLSYKIVILSGVHNMYLACQ